MKRKAVWILDVSMFHPWGKLDTKAVIRFSWLGKLGIPVDGDLYDVPARKHHRSDEE